ncbi:hypothetical protein ACIBKY_51485 [Nonomuraea sp. NPDC050394]|uniref:hypothetical protein n=1 Tax=Nonomuraea sp. NPDC050394 TaxID=3364363 RepID=UPI0037891023
MNDVPRWAQDAAQPFLRAGWTVADVLHALNTRPDGSPWLNSAFAHGTHDWATHRLSAWVDGHGQPRAPRTAVVTQQSAQMRQQQAKRAAEVDAMRATRSGRQAQHAQRARQMLAAASPAAARSMQAPQPQEVERKPADRWERERRDQQAAAAIADGVIAEKDWEPPVEDEPVSPQTVALARARTRARLERERAQSRESTL